MYEGEPIYAPYFHDLSLNISTEMFRMSGGGYQTLVDVLPEDLVMFPELPKLTTHMSVVENTMGFIHVEYLNDEEYKEILDDYEAEAASWQAWIDDNPTHWYK